MRDFERVKERNLLDLKYSDKRLDHMVPEQETGAPFPLRLGRILGSGRFTSL